MQSQLKQLVTGLGQLEQSIREHEAEKAFDRCMIGENWCQNTAINAHTIPRTTLRLIKGNDNHVIGTAQTPPFNPIQYFTGAMLDSRSINDFSVGRYACHDHDSMFSDIDNRRIDLDDDLILFLIIYRITLRTLYLTLRVGNRLVMSTLDTKSDVQSYGLPKEHLQGIQHAARAFGEPAARSLNIKTEMDRNLSTRDFGQFEFRATRWKTIPSLAACGMNFHEYPNPINGETEWSPEWIIILPQDYGQALITATLKGASRIGTDIHQGMPNTDREIQKRGNNWKRMMSQRMLTRAVDIAISPQIYSKFAVAQRRIFEEYVRTRTRENVNHRKLPNLLDW